MKETEKFEEQLRNMQQESFKVPDGYFEELPGKVMEKINLIEGKTTSGVNPFSTPDVYFEKLTVQINDRVTSKPSFIPVFKRRIVLIPLVCAILVAGFLFFNQNKKTERIEFSSTYLENSTVLQTIDEDMLIDELISLQKINTTDSLTQYLLDNIELSDLENAL